MTDNIRLQKRANNVRTGRLKTRLDLDSSIRLSTRDRAFLADLSVVGVIDESSATRHHYVENKSGAGRRLDKLMDAGILQRADIIDPSNGKIAVYSFSNDRVARAFGGRAIYTGANRTTYHELLVSRTYFDLDRPNDFRTASRFDKHDLAQFGARPPSPPHRQQSHHGVAREAAIPDATYTDHDGCLVVVEADAGHYTTAQIRQKQNQWHSFKQVWAQPVRPHAKVLASTNVEVIRY